ncbi:hypothetical protein BSKO_13942 [Bryopsis sp. KO-2023]|nr:hypothetical protein BSKO_13942 [Bryopsis sp. KO-2023]
MDRKDAFLTLFLSCTAALVISIVGIAIAIDSKCPCRDHGLEEVDDSTTTMDCNGGCTCFSESESTVECRDKTREMPLWGTALLLSLGISGAIGGIGWGLPTAMEKWNSFRLNDHDNESEGVGMSDTVMMESYGEWGILAGGRTSFCT